MTTPQIISLAILGGALVLFVWGRWRLQRDGDAPGAGHLLAICSDGLNDQSTLVILDALALAQGPIVRVPMPLLPVAFHGDWDPSAVAIQAHPPSS